MHALSLADADTGSNVCVHTHTLTLSHTHQHTAGWVLTSLGEAGDAGIPAAINLRQAYPCVHSRYAVMQHCRQCLE